MISYFSTRQRVLILPQANLLKQQKENKELSFRISCYLPKGPGCLLHFIYLVKSLILPWSERIPKTTILADPPYELEELLQADTSACPMYTGSNPFSLINTNKWLLQKLTFLLPKSLQGKALLLSQGASGNQKAYSKPKQVTQKKDCKGSTWEHFQYK